MRQIIVDFGTLDFSADTLPLRLAIYAALLALMLAGAWLSVRAARRRGEQPGSWAYLSAVLPVVVLAGVLELLRPAIPLRIFGYGLMMVLGFLAGIALAQWRAKRLGGSAETVAYLGLLALLGGVIGARLAYVIENYQHFAHAPPAEMLNITSGGLIYYGGVVLAVAAILGYLRAKRLPIRRYLDIIAPSLMLGLAFGRAGCLLNGCCFGGVCRADWPLATRFPMYPRPLIKVPDAAGEFSPGTEAPSPPYAYQVRTERITPDPRLLDEHGHLIPPREMDEQQLALALRQESAPVKPAQALGIVNALILTGILLAFTRLRRRDGQVFVLMLLLYPITRFLLETIRSDNPHDLSRGVLTHNQWTSIIMVVAAAGLWAALRRLPRTTAAPTAAPSRKGGREN
jgi:phosphatidylglycerol:prolipoprotein diacylglycerol transferase